MRETTLPLVLITASLALALPCVLRAQAVVDWAQRDHIPAPREVSPVPLAYDAASERVVALLSSTWEWNGGRWHRTAASFTPNLGGYMAYMAYDTARRESVLFVPFNGTTWTRGRGDWSRRTTQSMPSPRGSGSYLHHAMAYDPTRSRLVLCEGGETWEWDGVDWQDRTTTPAPSLQGHAMTFDAVRQRVVLFGGWTGAALTNGTWEWDGAQWRRIPTTTSPPATERHAMAHDRARRRTVVLEGGRTWEFDGTTWTQVITRNRPEVTALASMVYDPARGEIVLFGGDRFPFVARAETWSFDGNDWRLRSSSAATVDAGAVALDTGRNVLVGLRTAEGGQTGFGGSTSIDETWEWDGRRWSRRTTATQPHAGAGYGIAYDAARQRTVLFDGATWEWDGSTWQQLHPVTRPTIRLDVSMAFDASRAKTVLFGGDTDQTWEWDGIDWTLHAPAVRPDPRSDAAMAYDPVRQVTVLFGGLGLRGFPFPTRLPLGDTWEWDGVRWQQRTPTNSPPPGDGHMTWDATRGRVVHYGRELWEWDGLDWLRIQTARALPAALGGGLAQDPIRAALVNVGAAHTRFVGQVRPAESDSLGNGCSGQGSPPRLTSTLPRIGMPGFELALEGASPGVPGLLAVSTATRTIHLGSGCTAWIGNPTAEQLLHTSPFGAASWPIAVPEDRALTGLTLFAQGMVLDPQSPLGVALTNARRLRVGD